MATRAIVGFDSAWTDNPKAPGAICILREAPNGCWTFEAPRLVSFGGALQAIEAERARSDLVLVAIDQPTIVPNQAGSRPVDKVAASLISFIGGGVQPASRSKRGMFDDAAPIWQFKAALGASDDPEEARCRASGMFLMEVFPALALATFENRFHIRMGAAKYNPVNVRMYRHEDWIGVVDAAERVAADLGLMDMANWCLAHRHLVRPRKADQDRLDAFICALVGLHWLVADRKASIVVGDLETGYMVAPASAQVRARLQAAAQVRGVAIDAQGGIGVAPTPSRKSSRQSASLGSSCPPAIIELATIAAEVTLKLNQPDLSPADRNAALERLSATAGPLARQILSRADYGLAPAPPSRQNSNL